jgi:hypothetical protein
MNTYRNPSKKTSTLDPQHNTNKKDLLRVKVYAKIERLRQRIYNWETDNVQPKINQVNFLEEDLYVVDKHQENMDNDETYYPYTNSLIEMNRMWIEYKGKLSE